MLQHIPRPAIRAAIRRWILPPLLAGLLAGLATLGEHCLRAITGP